MWVQSLGQEDPLDKEMATHSSILAWEILWTVEPGGLQSMGSQKSWTWLSDNNNTVRVKYKIDYLDIASKLESEMATHSSILAWRIPWMQEPWGLQSTGSQRVRHDWATSLTPIDRTICKHTWCPGNLLLAIKVQKKQNVTVAFRSLKFDLKQYKY